MKTTIKQNLRVVIHQPVYKFLQLQKKILMAVLGLRESANYVSFCSANPRAWVQYGYSYTIMHMTAITTCVRLQCGPSPCKLTHNYYVHAESYMHGGDS